MPPPAEKASSHAGGVAQGASLVGRESTTPPTGFSDQAGMPRRALGAPGGHGLLRREGVPREGDGLPAVHSGPRIAPTRIAASGGLGLLSG
jgi:hypothetical protein